ncbi:SafA/ExsA family spore coat assembly protein, partial [Neobacillus dielmonensis]|uniref:SafA/ExsA family spore coat assembly protein n=1 Tax=Neobacillus dielmonensis TaxID=1347369 RepID=UPI0006937D40
MKIHIVQKGDTLWKIAKKYGVNFEELKKLNTQLSNPDMIMPGMKIKVPTTGGTIKKEGPVSNPGVKKEVPLKEQPVKEMPVPKKEVPIKEVPIKEVPVKEVPIAKEAPKAPYTPKMPLQIIPEIDVNNYYMMNMQQMKVEQPQLPPKPVNILPEVKPEVPKEKVIEKPITMPKTPVPPKEAPVQMLPPKEMPIQAPPPMEAPIVMPQQEYCVPVTPILPGSGFCPPFGGFPVQPYMPFQPVAGMPGPGMGAMPTGYVPPVTMPMAGGPTYMPHDFDDESSFIPPVPAYNPGGAVMGAQTGPFQQPMQMDPGVYGQMPMGYGQMPMGQGQMPMGYGQMPMGYGQMPMGYG